MSLSKKAHPLTRAVASSIKKNNKMNNNNNGNNTPRIQTNQYKELDNKIRSMQRKIEGFSRVSDLGYERYPKEFSAGDDWYLNEGIKNLKSCQCITGDAAPYDPSGRCAASVTVMADQDSLPSQGTTAWRGYIVSSTQGPVAFYYSGNQSFVYANSNDGIPLAENVQLQVFQSGPTLGFLWDPVKDLYLLSDIYDKSNPVHMWPINSKSQTQLYAQSDLQGTYTLYDAGFNPLITADINDTAITFPAADTLYYFSINVDSSEQYFPPNGTAVYINGVSGSEIDAHAEVGSGNAHVLSPKYWDGYQDLNTRTDVSRINISGFVFTFSGSDLVLNGNLTSGEFQSGGYVTSPWSDAAWTQYKHYKDKMKRGFSYALTCSYSRPYYTQNAIIPNPIAWPESKYVLTYITTNLASITDELQCMLKFTGWCDYPTNLLSITKNPIWHKGSSWVETVAHFQQVLVMTDNPNHLKMRDHAAQFIRWMSSNKPAPAAIRQALKVVAKAAGEAAPAILGLL